ncbi:UNVERIFIED_CONTAM: hypothetical protein Sradi_3969800 [Sesamum radiatum]|uniref:SWIM-type domain-containing protein n=1 Tax=Sesamum radiatum TaxID=300843 RepID=A0AAW2PHM8_SESRA
MEEFKARMEQLKELDENEYKWLVQKPTNQWSRDKPIITLLETIRNMLMIRMQVNRDKARKWGFNLCPKIKDDLHFQIIGPFDQHNVDLLNRSCSCRRWDLTGIPCRHTISAIWCRNEDPQDYVHDVYKCELPPPLSPKYENKPGRPKKMRRRQPDEPPAATNTTRMKKCQKSLRCGKCGVVGHNTRTCNKSSGQAEEMPTGTSQPPSTQESNHSQPISLEPFNMQFVTSQPATTLPRRKKLPVSCKYIYFTYYLLYFYA